jgi:murein DD-endopeptidase MepM/ murein hydrolase activator NlpD
MSLLKGFFKIWGKIFSKKITVMLVPHSQKRILNFNISYGLITILLSFVAIAVLIGVFVPKELVQAKQGQEEALAQFQTMDKKHQTLSQLAEQLAGATDSLIVNINSLMAVLVKNDNELQVGQGGRMGDVNLFGADSEIANGDYHLNAENSMKNDINSILEANDKLKGLKKELEEISTTLKVFPSIHPLLGKGYILSGFGPRVHPITHKITPHRGIDIGEMAGTPIRATASGVVKTARYSGGAGYMVAIKHDYGFMTRYLHMLPDLKVKEGDVVKKGQVVGYLGSTGFSTGPHLHYEVLVNGVHINPAPFIHIDKLGR